MWCRSSSKFILELRTLSERVDAMTENWIISDFKKPVPVDSRSQFLLGRHGQISARACHLGVLKLPASLMPRTTRLQSIVDANVFKSVQKLGDTRHSHNSASDGNVQNLQVLVARTTNSSGSVDGRRRRHICPAFTPRERHVRPTNTAWCFALPKEPCWG